MLGARSSTARPPVLPATATRSGVAAAPGSTLPVTGTDVVGLTIVGLAAIVGGTVLVRRSRVRPAVATDERPPGASRSPRWASCLARVTISLADRIPSSTLARASARRDSASLLGRRPKLIEGSGGRNPQVFGVVASLLADPIGLVVGRTDDPSRLVAGQPHDLGRIGLGPPQSHRRADALVIAGGRSAARHGAGSGCGPQVAGHRPEQVLHLRRLEAAESHGELSLFEAVGQIDRVLRGGDVVPVRTHRAMVPSAR